MEQQTLFDDLDVRSYVQSNYKDAHSINLEECVESLKGYLREENVNFHEYSDRIVVKRRGQTTMNKVKNAMQKLSQEYKNLNYLFSIATLEKTIVIKEKTR